MKHIQKVFVIIITIFVLCAVSRIDHTGAAGPKVSENGNKHNLSALAWSSGSLGPKSIINTYQATNDQNANPGGQQVCIFCHTPHNANSAAGTPLWNREFSSQTFQRYTSATLRIRIDATARGAAGFDSGWAPDGASKLCLSCHDGVSSLGNVLRGGPITMTNDTITGFASFKPNTTNYLLDKMKSGHHPISFKYDDSVRTAINSAKTGYVLPTFQEIKLDRNGKMQCTTCHNAHQNMSIDTQYYVSAPTRKVAPFWVYHNGSNDAIADHDAVCKNCHPIAPDPTTNPW